jgi:hypothetical protein
LTEKTPAEIAQYLQAILSARYVLHKKGFKLKIRRRSKSTKITPA